MNIKQFLYFERTSQIELTIIITHASYYLMPTSLLSQTADNRSVLLHRSLLNTLATMLIMTGAIMIIHPRKKKRNFYTHYEAKVHDVARLSAPPIAVTGDE